VDADPDEPGRDRAWLRTELPLLKQGLEFIDRERRTDLVKHGVAVWADGS